MSLKGNLQDFSLIQLLNLINLAKKSGALFIEREGEYSRTDFQDGKIAFIHNDLENDRLLNLLHRVGLINKGQVQTLNKRLNGQGDKEIGIYLVNAGYLSQEQIVSALESQAFESMRKLFSWSDGIFRFDTAEPLQERYIPVHLDLENIIVEGSRELQELEELKAEIPSLGMALRFTERPGTDIRNFNLSMEEWRVVSYINPKNTIQQIATTLKMDEVQVRRVVYTLLQAGFVELIRLDGLPVRIPGKAFPNKKPEEQKSLVKRLMDRIRSI